MLLSDFTSVRATTSKAELLGEVVRFTRRGVSSWSTPW